MGLLVSFLSLKNISGIARFVLVPEKILVELQLPFLISKKTVKWLVSLLLMALTAGDGAPVVENSTETL